MASRVKTLPPLSEQAIVEAALTIADADGLSALSMRSLAAKLQCNPMSLYEHVTNKEALLDLMADRAMTALPELVDGGDWRVEMRRFFTAFHELFLAHPAIAHVMVTRPLAGPVTLKRGEPALSVLVTAGISDSEAVQIFISLASYTIGASLYELARQDTTERDVRLDELTASSHPMLARLAPHLRDAAGEEQFQQGLDRLLGSQPSTNPNN